LNLTETDLFVNLGWNYGIHPLLIIYIDVALLLLFMFYLLHGFVAYHAE